MWQLQYAPQVRDINQPVTFTLNEFTERTLTAFEKAVHKAHEMDQPIFVIRVQSDGGYADILFGMMSIMASYRERGMKFAGVVSGSAASAGCVIFLYCDFRYMGEFANLLFHSSQLHVSGDLPNVLATVKSVQENNERMFETVGKHLKKPKGWFKNQLKKHGVDDWTLTSEQALAAKIIDEIRIPEFNVRISCEFSIT